MTEGIDFTELFKQIAQGKIVMITTKFVATITCSPDNLKLIKELLVWGDSMNWMEVVLIGMGVWAGIILIALAIWFYFMKRMY